MEQHTQNAKKKNYNLRNKILAKISLTKEKRAYYGYKKFTIIKDISKNVYQEGKRSQ